MDALFSGGLLRTKDDVKREAYGITRDARQLENIYKTLYTPVEELSESYRVCKNQIFFFRYGSIKQMIESCIHTYEEVHTFEKAKESGECVKGLLGAAHAFKEASIEMNEIAEEVEPLKKSELLQHLKDMEIKCKRLKARTQRLDNSINRLQTEYTASKRNNPFTRYRRMKNMAKVLTRNVDLKP